MAWAVLAYPQAPRAFRSGLVRIALDEIRHMHLYAAEVSRLGHRIGDFAVRDWFWERVPLATEPALLLLDEPAAGMNPQESRDLMDLIRWIRDEFSLTILLVEHNMKVVMGICEQIQVIDYGEAIAFGTPAEIQRNPAVIAAYLGGGH